MNARDRVCAALSHLEPDRVPIDIGTSDTFIASEVYRGMAELLGLEPTAAEESPHPSAFITPDEMMLNTLGADVRLVPVTQRSTKRRAHIGPNDTGKEETLSDGSVEWIHPDGRIYRRAAGNWDVQLFRPALVNGLSSEEIDRILPASPRQISWANIKAARRAIRRWHEWGMAVQCNNIIMPVTGTAGGYLDFTSWCIEFASQPKLLCKLMDRYLEHAFARAESFYAAVGEYADVVYGLGDDVASQTGMWMSPEDYRRYVKPRHAEIIKFIKARSSAKIIHHCCGACREILPDLIEIGVDAINPTQTSAIGMDPFALKHEFGNDISFWGGIDVMHLLPTATTIEVEDAVKRHIDALAPGGGYIFSPSHIIQRFTPPENVLAMYRTALEYG